MPPDTGRRPQPIRNELLNVEEMIRARAYELYEARGRQGGNELDDWLRAEYEITQQQRKTRTTAA
ncbi:MAG TPA: DUF2934 domain-containing protein [Terriglobales bacterium]|jgi:hypothetical protein|nr:DUF2934 domain-containing protein [Terriglobales bacterium]